MAPPEEGKNPAVLTGLFPRMLFRFMSLLVVGAFAWFFVQSMLLLNENLDRIRSKTRSQQTAKLLESRHELSDQHSRLSFLAKSRVALEHDVTFYRHVRTSSALMTRTWMRFMSLAFGTLLVANGSLFVLGRVTAPQTDASVQWQEVRVSLVSSSPGLVLAFLGCFLIAVPNITKQRIDARDASVYMQEAEDTAPAKEMNSVGGLPAVAPEAAKAKAVDDLTRDLMTE